MAERGEGCGGCLSVALIAGFTRVSVTVVLYDEAKSALGISDPCWEHRRALDVRDGVISDNETAASQLEYGMIDQQEYEAKLQPVPDEPAAPEGC